MGWSEVNKKRELVTSFSLLEFWHNKSSVRWGMWKHVKWDLGGGSSWRRCSFPAAGSKNHLGNFHCLAKPLCAPFKISVHSVFCDFSCFFTTLFTVQKITVHCLKSVLKVSDLCMNNIFVISLVVGLTLGSPIKCKCKLITICLLW